MAACLQPAHRAERYPTPDRDLALAGQIGGPARLCEARCLQTQHRHDREGVVRLEDVHIGGRDSGGLVSAVSAQTHRVQRQQVAPVVQGE